MHTYTSDIDVTPLQKILPTGLDYVLKVSHVLLSICLASQLYYPLSIPPEQRLRLVRETGTLAHVYYTDRDILHQWEPSFVAQH